MEANMCFTVQKMGYVIPLAIFATIFLSVGSGLLSILGPDSSTGEWIGFQIITGAGSGAGLQLVRLPCRLFYFVSK
jgi:hypothetical protein